TITAGTSGGASVGSGSGPATATSTSARGTAARAPGSSTPGAVRTRSGALSATMCASSRSPDFGLIGTTGTPAASAPTTATHVSSDAVAHTATRAAGAMPATT